MVSEVIYLFLSSGGHPEAGEIPKVTQAGSSYRRHSEESNSQCWALKPGTPFTELCRLVPQNLKT